MDMNDMYVGDSCSTKVHSRGLVFTISELMDIAIAKLTFDELAAHLENKENK